MRRFFVSPQSIDGRHVSLRGEIVHRLSRVLRMSRGDEVVLLDGLGTEYVVRLDELGRDTALGTVLRTYEDSNEPGVRITLCQGILKGEKLDWVLQKGTELGIAEFVPLICKRSVPRVSVEKGSRRMLRWSKVVAEAAEQCGRSRMPGLCLPTEFEAACRLVDSSSLGLIPWEETRKPGVKEVLRRRPVSRVYLFIGPEGGFQREEVEYAQSLGILPVSLGKRVFRAETAGLVTATAVLYEAGELGG